MNTNWQWCQFLPQLKQTSLRSFPTRPWPQRLENSRMRQSNKHSAKSLHVQAPSHLYVEADNTVNLAWSYPSNYIHPSSTSWKTPYIWRHEPTQIPRERRTVHHTCFWLQKHQPTRTTTDQPPTFRLQPKMACSYYGPRHRSYQQTTTTHLLSPLNQLWTDHSNRTEPETRRIH